MASETDTSTARRSDPSTVSAAARRLDPLLLKIRDGLSQYLEAFALAIQGARRQDIKFKWPLFVEIVPDPGDGGTIAPVQQEAGDFVGIESFGLCKFNIPVSEADIETAARYLQHCGLDPDAQRLLEVFKELKAAFCSVGEYIPISDDSMANRKFYAQDRALMLSEHLEDLIRTPPTILTGGGPTDAWPPDDEWHLREGTAAYLGVTFRIHGIPAKLLDTLFKARFPCGEGTLVDAAEMAGGKGSLRTHLTNCRKVLRAAFDLPKDADPIPSKGRGVDVTWQIDLKLLQRTVEVFDGDSTES